MFQDDLVNTMVGNIMGADVLAMQGARESATVILTMAANVMAPCVTRSSAAKVLNMQGK